MNRWHLIALTVILVTAALLAGHRPAAVVETPVPPIAPATSSPAIVASKSPAAPRGLKGVKACQSNLKQIATALEMYATDHNGHYPKALSELIPTYLDNIPSCPAAGEETYSAGYREGAAASGNVHDWPDYYRVVCFGAHHSDAGIGENSPAFDCAAGLTPELAFEGTPQEARHACENNLKNLGTALEMYSADHQGKYPRSLAELTPNYLRAVPKCQASGTDTYTSTYKRIEVRDGGMFTFSVRCSGQHKGATPSNGPAYDSVRGLSN